jgi:tRNA G18 (ribose-2'-O)-methylase SpoU
MSTAQRVTLVGDGIENEANARVMNEAAAMFGAACRVRSVGAAAQVCDPLCDPPQPPHSITAAELAQLHTRRIAFDNLPGAREVYGYRAGNDFALIVGNERRGLSHSFKTVATEAVQIPMHSRQMNCLNVAAAAAVGLYYLCAEPVRPLATRSNVAARRPTLLLLGAAEHIELGSSIRSAAAFGWERALIEDRDGVWFGVDRIRRSEGRAAARRARNDIRVMPCTAATRYDADEAVIVTTRRLGPALRHVDLARGARQIIVVPAENRVDVEREDWHRVGRKISFAHLEIPAALYQYHYRSIASIVLAEIARQVGVVRSERRPPPRRGLEYDWTLPVETGDLGEQVSWAELMAY